MVCAWSRLCGLLSLNFNITDVLHLMGKTRVVSSEISGGKFPEIYSNLSGNLLNNYFHFIIFNYNHTKKYKNKHVLDKQLSRIQIFVF